jgi:transposase-like protein
MKKNINDLDLIKLFNSGKTIKEMSKIYCCNQETIRLRLKKNGINTSKKECNISCLYCGSKTRKEGKINKNIQRYKCLSCNKTFSNSTILNKNKTLEYHHKIKKMYLVDNLSTTEISKILGVSSTIPQRILKKYGLTRSIAVAIDTKLANNLGLTYDEYIESLPAYKKYKTKVWYYTRKEPINQLLNYDKRGLCGVEGAYQLDHKYSILEGFKNGIDPKIIGNIKNLEFIPWKDNRDKGSNCSVKLDEIYPSTDIIVRVR